MLALALAATAHAGAPMDCDQDASMIDSVVDADGYVTKYDLSSMGYDPKPLLTKTFKVQSGSSCVMAQVSLHTLTGWGYGDEFAAIKVTIDGLPMFGETTACATNGVNVPCILLSNTSGSDSHSYHLVYPGIKEGEHTIEVWYAGVDTDGVPEGAYVGGSLLSVHHQ